MVLQFSYSLVTQLRHAQTQGTHCMSYVYSNDAVPATRVVEYATKLRTLLVHRGRVPYLPERKVGKMFTLLDREGQG